MKAGDIVKTPNGEGTIEDFEVQPQLGSPLPVTYLHTQPPHNPLEFVRVGVRGSHPHLKVAYYPLHQINRDHEL